MELQAHRLRKTKYKNALVRTDYATTQRLLDAENAQYQRRFVPRNARRLGDVLGEFEVFVRSITTMVQGGGEICMFVWGAIQAVLDVSSTPATKDTRACQYPDLHTSLYR